MSIPHTIGTVGCHNVLCPVNPANPRPRILITGPGGRIGPHLLKELRPHFRLHLLDRKPLCVVEDDTFVQADIRDADAMRQACQNIDALVHLAAISDEDEFYGRLLPYNLEGVHTVFEAARRAGVPKVVFASTGQTVVNYPRDAEVTTEMPARPCTVYACTKLFGEALARHYADAYGMSMICLRICWFQPYDSPALRRAENGMHPYWCSPGDLGRIVTLALRAPRLFGIYFAISNNRGRKWDVSNARAELGYEPRDDSSVYLERA